MSGPLAAGAAVAATVLAGVLALAAPRPVRWRTGWIETAGIGVGLHLDDLALLFVVLVVGIGVPSLVYSLRFIPHAQEARGMAGGEVRYHAAMVLFIGAMLGLALAEDLVQLYVFWELADVASFLLIAFDRRDPRARAAAVKALLVTTFGGLCLLAGIVCLGSIAGSFSIPELVARADLLKASPLLPVALVLVVVAAATKSAQFPFHTWLPGAMIAPVPVNAFLDGAALLASGVYLLARLHPIFAGAALWEWGLSAVGVASMAAGAALALRATDLKVILAYSTISQYGFMFALLGQPGGDAVFAALLFVVQHGMLKAALFFGVGAVTWATGAEALGQPGRIAARLPLVFLATGALALSLAGVPPLGGFWMKEAFLEAALAGGRVGLATMGVAASALTLVYMLRFVAGTFTGGPAVSAPVRMPPPSIRLVPAALAGVTVLTGLWPDTLAVWLVAPAARAVAPAAPLPDLTLHLGLPLLLSLLALALGIVAFATRRRWATAGDVSGGLIAAIDRVAGGAAEGVTAAAHIALRVQNGALRRYVTLVLLGLLGVAGASLVAAPPALPAARPGVLVEPARTVALVGTLLLVGVASVLALVLRRHLHVVLALGVAGYLIAGVFALARAPAVGLVQAHVETLLTVLLLLGLIRVHAATAEAQRPPHGASPASAVALAAAAGVAATVGVWLAIEHRAPSAVAPWLVERGPALTGATDLVAGVLLHIRALDTLGEIVVFAAACVGVRVLVRLLEGDR